MPDTTAQRIRAARLSAGLTVRELAALALGGAKNARLIGRWERGEGLPSLASLQKIAPALGLSVADLIPESTIQKGAA